MTNHRRVRPTFGALFAASLTLAMGTGAFAADPDIWVGWTLACAALTGVLAGCVIDRVKELRAAVARGRIEEVQHGQ